MSSRKRNLSAVDALAASISARVLRYREQAATAAPEQAADLLAIADRLERVDLPCVQSNRARILARLEARANPSA